MAAARIYFDEDVHAFIADALRRNPKVEKVMYPGLKDHPGHGIAREQMRGFGAMLAFEIKGGGRAAEKFIDALPGYLLPDAASQGRIGVVLARLREISKLS